MDTRNGFTPSKFFVRPRSAPALAAVWITAAFMSACSSGSGDAGVTGPPIPKAVINVQPADQSVPMGLAATFAVSTAGESLQYQWMKNGAAIGGANDPSYTTPATTFADTGANFTVAVTNSAGTVTSSAASLTVTARAPMAGDLRFQQVDAPSTVNGWGNAGVGLSTLLLPRSAQDFSPSLGTPFYVGGLASGAGNCGATPVTDATGCAWAFTQTPFNTSSSSPTLLTGYGSDFFDNLQADLQDSAWPQSFGASPASPSSVITSLDLEPANVLFALAWVQSMQQTVFQPVQNTVAPANLEAAANQEGANSRVITAVSNNAGAITYISYGWQADTATIYEAHVVTSSPTDAPSAAADLAAQGFIITATGTADDSGNVLLVGTRVQGDVMARPFVAAQGAAAIQAMTQQGYANIAVIVDYTNPTNPYTFLGER
jgi:hypothetical protein